jgi:hypothetical protein
VKLLPIVRQDWLIILLAVSVASMACFEVSDGDLGFHLATGREILATGKIPSSNVLSFGEPQHAWLLHQWLPALLFEWLWRRWGVVGVISTKMLVITTTWLLSYVTARVLGASARAATAACLLAACASAFRFEARPYLFTHWTLALTWLAVARGARATRDGSKQQYAALALAGLSVVLGSQLHAGVLDSVLVLVLFGLGTLLEGVRARLFGVARQPPYGVPVAARWLITALLASAVAAGSLALYHPWGARVLAVPFQMLEQRYWSEHLVEFRHAWAFPAAVLLAYWLWLACVLVTLFVARQWLHAGYVVVVLAYAVISLSYVRMAYAFALLSAPPVAAGWTHWAAARAERVGGAGQRQRFGHWLASFGLVGLVCAAPLYVYRDHTPGFGLASWVWPVEHFAFIRAHDIRGRAFVSDAWAGPFLGTFYPERKVFFDNRLEAYSDGFARHVYQRIRYGEPGWDRLLDSYQIDIVLLRYTTPGEARWQHGKPNLRQHLAQDARYQLVYFDDDGELFVRHTPPNEPLLASYALPDIDPDRRLFLRRPASCVGALVLAVQRGNHSSTLLGLAAVALADAGDARRAAEFLRIALAQAPNDAWLHDVSTRIAAATRH